MNTPDSTIEKLIKLAGGRDQPSSEGMERAREAARDSWARMLKSGDVAHPLAEKSLRFKLLGFALAAGIAAVGVFLATRLPQTAPPEVVAHVATLSGGARLEHASADTAVAVASPVHAGATLTTGDGRLALTFGDALSLRVDRQTRLRFDSRGQITLLAGVLYVDSGGINTVPALRIETPAGVVRHVGTQYQVRVAGDVTLVRVREGRVLLSRASGASTDMAAGDELELSGAEVRWRRGLPSFGEDWEWAAGIAPALEIENRPLAEFITWVAREHGWRVRFVDVGLQSRAAEIRLHGSLDPRDSAAMLERVALVTGVPMNVRDGVLWIGE
jgi:ferric-dicitrate binding protein FerR (iron transport regulator)